MQAEWQAHIETMMDEYRRLRERLAGLRSALANLTETVGSADGMVTVTVDHGGRLISLDLDPAHVSGPSAELSARIVAAAGLAAQRVADRSRTLIGEIVPGTYLDVAIGDADPAVLLPGDPSDPAGWGGAR